MDETVLAGVEPQRVEADVNELERQVRRVERRDWFLWVTAIAVNLLLLAAVVFLSLPALFEPGDPSDKLSLQRSIRGLAGSVLLFSLYVLRQQFQIKRLRQDLTNRMHTVLHLRRAAEQFQRLAMLDPLTGLYNRRLADERLKAEVTRSNRHKRPFSLCLFDLNDFKAMNDSYGHLVGDEVLKEFARRLTEAIRSSDVAARIGGDEFLLLLPECHEKNVKELLSRLVRLEVEVEGKRFPFSYSAGWTECREDDSPQTLLERADRSLYTNKRAKQAMRNALHGPSPWKGTGKERII